MTGETQNSASTHNGVEKKVIRLAIGSKNPAKLKACEDAIRRCLDRKESNVDDYVLKVEGFGVESGVDSQPFGDETTCQGAKNRAKAAFLKYREEFGSFPHLAIGLEGGLERVDFLTEKTVNSTEGELLYCMAWMAVMGRRQALTVDMFASDETRSYYGDKKPIFGLAKTASFPLPQGITNLVLKEGMELGDADDKFFSRTNSKHGSGTVGILTDSLVDRSEYYVHALLMALTPWIRPELYQS